MPATLCQIDAQVRISFFQAQIPDPKTYREHFESKHPKSPLPPELEESTSAE